MEGLIGGRSDVHLGVMSEGKEPIRVVIDRSRWLRGEGSDESEMLRTVDDKMCCLGFCARALGISRKAIEGRGTPITIDSRECDTWDQHVDCDYTLLERAMTINDRFVYDSTRESQLTELLAPWFTLTFVDGPVES